MHTLKFFILPSLAVAVWVSLAAGTVVGFGRFAAATQPAPVTKPAPAPVAPTTPVLTATR